MSVLGIDQSLTGTGVYSTATDSGMTIDPGKAREGARLSLIEGRVRELLERDRPQLVVIEGYGYGTTQNREALGELGGVLRMLFHRRVQPYLVIPPASLKLFATGHGNADKKQMVEAAAATGRIFRDHNQADAFWLAMVGTYVLMPPMRWLDHGLTSAQVSVLKQARGKVVK